MFPYKIETLTLRLVNNAEIGFADLKITEKKFQGISSQKRQCQIYSKTKIYDYFTCLSENLELLSIQYGFNCTFILTSFLNFSRPFPQCQSKEEAGFTLMSVEKAFLDLASDSSKFGCLRPCKLFLYNTFINYVHKNATSVAFPR